MKRPCITIFPKTSNEPKSKKVRLLGLMQGRSQPHSPGWARVPLSSFFPQILINFSYFSSNFTYFLPHFGPPGGWVAHPGRPWLRHWTHEPFDIIVQTEMCFFNSTIFTESLLPLNRTREKSFALFARITCDSSRFIGTMNKQLISSTKSYFKQSKSKISK